MSEWWEKAYRGAPMLDVPGFPRALFPPDATRYGKRPSVNGPDVEAYKRTVARGGRWPWQDFDQAYSNGFAHGTSGNVGQTGVAGVQRQQDIDDTGWIGEKTFNTFRSMLVPDGLPHAGEYCMDALAVTLIWEAWEMFGGQERPPASGGTVRSFALDRAKDELGTVESPANSNQVKYTDWYGMLGPWCAMFVTWCFELGARDLNRDSLSFVQGQRYAYVPYLLGDAQANRYGLSITDDPIPGDLVLYDWDWNAEHDHIGIFERWIGGGWFECIEGNTSPANDSNGGQVMRRERHPSQQGTIFVRVQEP